MSYAAVSALVRALPDARALDVLRRATGVRRILLHDGAPPDAAWNIPGVAAIQHVSGTGVVELEEPPAQDLLPALLDASVRDTTPLGTPVAALAETARRVDIRLSNVPSSVYAGLAFTLPVRVTNQSSAPWPGFAAREEHLVQVAYRWESPSIG